jgi:hypothetical protein
VIIVQAPDSKGCTIKEKRLEYWENTWREQSPSGT